jgi:hypothetical protein
MKRMLCSVLMILLTMSMQGFGQTKMFINKKDGSADSIVINLIKSITFKSTPVPTDSLVAYYPFNGNASDESGRGNNGTVTGATLVPDRFGVSGKAYSFNGTSNKIVVPGFHPNMNAFSVSFWMSTATPVTGATTRWLIGDGASYKGFIIMQQQDSVRFQVFDGISIGGHQADLGVGLSTADNGKWIHFCMTYGSGKLVVYRDGVAVRNGNGPVAIASTVNLGFGHDEFQFFNSYYNGILDDIRIYNRVLSPAEAGSLAW